MKSWIILLALFAIVSGLTGCGQSDKSDYQICVDNLTDDLLVGEQKSVKEYIDGGPYWENEEFVAYTKIEARRIASLQCAEAFN